MALTKDLVRRALTGVDGPDGIDLVTSGAVEWIAVCEADASVKLSVEPTPGREQFASLATACAAAVTREAKRDGVSNVSLLVQFVDEDGSLLYETRTPSAGSPPVREQPPEAAANAKASSLPGVDHVIAVGAGKGGVGKSTVAVNLAVGLARRRLGTGLLDGDIYGPSLPTMLGLGAMEQIAHEGKLQPFLVHGVKAVTIGKLVDPEKPLIWRGPMAHGAFQQLTTRTNWGELDRLVIDLPPGTGDIPLTMAQSLQLSGAVIVCTPQRVAQDDAVRATRMFQQLGVEILGVVENMSYFVGDDGKTYDLFGRGGAEIMAQRLGLPFLGAIPINTALRKNGDAGEPLRNFDPETAGGEQLPKALEQVVGNLESQLALARLRTGSAKPKLTIS
ncbi:MAG: sodium:proton antiporter [Phycisphaerae bacterium]|nr:sodium:proton antiporter [Phycisphaerae bacterium]